MGSEIAFEKGIELRIISPVDAQLRLMRSGKLAAETSGRELAFAVSEPGVYRAEAHLLVRGRRLPWIYSNPIYIRQAATPVSP